MTQRRRFQSIVLLTTVVFSAMFLWALIIMVQPPPVAYADPPSPPQILTITVTSSKGAYFYDPGLGEEGGTVYFNSLAGEGGGQVITVTMTVTGTMPITLTGATAFGMTPISDTDFSGELGVTYTIGISAGTENGILFTATASDGFTDTARITFTQDITDPTIVSPSISETSSYLYANNPTLYYSDLMSGTSQSFIVQGNATDNGGAGLDRATFSSAFGVTPTVVHTPTAWSGTYDDVESTDGGNGTITVRVYDKVGNWSSSVFTYIEDTITPTVVFTDVTNPDYDFGGGELDDNGSNWYDPDNLSAGWYFTSTVTDTLSGLALTYASWDHSADNDNHFTYPDLDGTGVFTDVASDGDGTVTVTLTITDNVGNSSSDSVVLNLDNTEPEITDPQIDESSFYLHAVSLTIYYGDDMPGSRAFTVQGNAQDTGVGLDHVAYSAALNQVDSQDFIHLENWYRDYTARPDNTTSGVITATIYDRVGNFATQTFTYTRDVVSPTLSGPFTITETSPYLHAEGTTVYYSHQMGSVPQSFTVQGNAADNEAGLDQASFSPALGSGPGYDYTPDEWSRTYNDVEDTDWGSGTITVTVYDNVSNWSEHIFYYVEDTTVPTVEFTDVTDPGYDSGGGELDTDGSNWYDPENLSAGWYFTSTVTDTLSGLALANASWDHSDDAYDQPVNDPGIDGTGVFTDVVGDGDGTVTVTLTITDNVGNPGSALVVFNIDNTEPTITSPDIDDFGAHLYVVDDLTVYYGDDMTDPEIFRVHGNAQDIGGVGLHYVAYSAALGEPYAEDYSTPVSPWSRDYTADQTNTTSGMITATIYDWLGNFTSQVFTYTQDTDDPTSAAISPQYDNGNPIVVTYTNATDTGGSGLQGVELWYKTEVTGTWIDSGLFPQTSYSGTFDFIPTGDGTYYFASIATDNVGNQEYITTTDPGDDATIYDTISPTVPAGFTYQLDSESGSDEFPPEPGYYDDLVIGLEWNPSTDGGSGLPTNPYHLGTAPHPTDGSYSSPVSYTVSSSEIYTFYLTAEDNAGNISNDTATGPVIVDTQPPQGEIVCPPGTANTSFVVSWSATDQGPADLRDTDPYSVSYNVDGGAWQDWITSTSAIAATFGPTSPVTVTVEYTHTYCFRVRAVDRAGNVQYISEPDDCTEVGPAYGPKLESVFLPIIMAPDPNWGFELGNFTNWQHGGQLAQSVPTAMPYSGNYSARLGSPSYACNNGVPVGNAWLRRSVVIPSGVVSPTLSFWYRIYTQDKNTDLSDQYDLFAVDINGTQVWEDANTSDPFGCSTLKDLEWRQPESGDGISLVGYEGQTIQITFYVYNRPDKWYNTYVYIDDVSVQWQ